MTIKKALNSIAHKDSLMSKDSSQAHKANQAIKEIKKETLQ